MLPFTSLSMSVDVLLSSFNSKKRKRKEWGKGGDCTKVDGDWSFLRKKAQNSLPLVNSCVSLFCEGKSLSQMKPSPFAFAKHRLRRLLVDLYLGVMRSLKVFEEVDSI